MTRELSWRLGLELRAVIAGGLRILSRIDAAQGDVFRHRPSLTPLDWGMHLATQVEQLRADGSRVETIFPDTDAEHLFGANAMDPSLRAPAAQAGYDQGRALGEPLMVFWG